MKTTAKSSPKGSAKKTRAAKKTTRQPLSQGQRFSLGIFALWAIILVCNETSLLHLDQKLADASSFVIPVDSSVQHDTNNKKTVYLEALATTDKAYQDDTFGRVMTGVLKVHRQVEMYQRTETQTPRTVTTSDGSQTQITDYSYDTVRSSSLIDSSVFHTPEGHQNPGNISPSDYLYEASPIYFGAFELSPELTQQMDNYRDLPVTASLLSKSPVKNYTLQNGDVYLGSGKTNPDPSNPHIGDRRISYRQIDPQWVSVVAKQDGQSFVGFDSGSDAIQILELGKVSLPDMFDGERVTHATREWIRRIVSRGLLLRAWLLSRRPQWDQGVMLGVSVIAALTGLVRIRSYAAIGRGLLVLAAVVLWLPGRIWPKSRDETQPEA